MKAKMCPREQTDKQTNNLHTLFLIFFYLKLIPLKFLNQLSLLTNTYRIRFHYEMI